MDYYENEGWTSENETDEDEILESESEEDVIDLHGYSVPRAINLLMQRVDYMERHNLQQLTVIVGQGYHSYGGEPRIKPAVIDFARFNRISYYYDPINSGRILLDVPRCSFCDNFCLVRW
jgi:hypothetical protein